MQAKHLSPAVLRAVQLRLAEKARLQLLAEALDTAIERLVEQDTGVNLRTHHWALDLEAGVITREGTPRHAARGTATNA